MYKRDNQLRIEDFVFPYGKLNRENEWVKLAELVPWETVEEIYALQFENNGHPAHPARMALGALIIKQRLKCSDVWTVRHISENPYLQYFIGLKEYSDVCPFGASTMVAFRKRFSQEDIAAILVALYFKRSNRLKNYFVRIMRAVPDDAPRLLSDWLALAEQYGQKEFEACIKAYHNWSAEILNAIRFPWSNGYTEGCNNKTKVLKRVCFGVRNFSRFRNRILHCV